MVTDDAARFGNATGYDEQGGYVIAAGDGSYNSDGLQVSWYLEDLGLDSRAARVEAGRPGTYDVRISYRGLPYRLFDTTDTVYASTGNSLQLPDGWTRSALTSEFTGLNASLVGRDIESDRDIIEVGGSYRPNSRFELFADFRNQTQNGVDEFGGAHFTQASLLPRSFDYQTDELDLGVRYRSERGYAQLGFYGSFFQNKDSVLVWDNPFTSFPGAERSALAQPPDNRFGQFLFKAGYRFKNATRLLVSGAFGNMEQDEALLPYTINPNVSVTPLPRARLNGEVDTTNLLVSLSSRPITPLSLKLSYRYDERDNQTTQEVWNRVIVDSLASGEDETNRPYSFDRTSLTASAGWTIRTGLRIGAGYERRELDRDLQEVAEQTEDTGWGRIHWRPNAYVELSGRGGTAKREIDRYDTELALSLGQQPLLRKYNLAHRFREFGELTFSGSLPHTPLSLSATVAFADDDYSKSVLGLLASEELRYGIDLSWSVSEKTQLYANLGLQQVDAEQAGSSNFSTPDWRAQHEDEFLTAGFGVKLKQITERVDLTFDYTYGAGDSAIDVTTSGERGPLPGLDSTLDSLRLSAVYRFSKRLQWIAELRYEAFEADDWALQGVAPATIPTVLTLGADPYDYDVF
ncbi:MAG: MtrB/PioB family decaheme-associated outer membrane protein, partial [Pseudomonadales bacterium]